MDFSKFLAARPGLRFTATSQTTSSITSSRRPTDVDPLGLHAVTNPKDPIADIIFVHGLGGSAFRTWSWKRNPENFWPTWLSRDEHLGSCRVLTFGYNSNFKGDARGLDVIDFAKDLLLQMLNYPNGLGKGRPILFIAHSMGGLVVKKAYTLGKHDKRFAGLISGTAGIIFLATPHRGSRYAKTLNNILAATSIVAQPKTYIAALERQSPVIQDINEVFGHQCEDLALVSFYETLPTRLMFAKLIIVEKDSAVLGYANEMSASMNADHNTISKYENEFDPNFVKLKDTLRRLLPKLAASPQGAQICSAESSKEIHGILGVLDIAEDDLYAHRVHVRHLSGTWWLDSENGFAAWLQATTSPADPRFYWLFGLPGSGKTVLSTMVIGKLQERNQIVQYHFFSEAHRAKQAVAYGLRSIATQLALSNELFRQALLSLHQATGLSFNNQNQSFHSIWEKIFERIIFQLRFSQPLVWVLDGVDESDTPDILLAHLSQIRSQTPIKIFFSSRPLKAISRFDSAQIRSYFLREEDTAEDIRGYATNVLQRALPDYAELLRDVVSQIMKYASGSFLWVKLALDTLEENWHTQDDIRAALTEVPNGMIPMYQRMLSTIEDRMPRSRNMARRILTWATCGWRPLCLDELQVALEPEFSSFINLEDTVTQICGHFIKITLSNSLKQVSLIHQTARDFLLKGDPDSGITPFIDPQEGHQHLAMVCLKYLSSRHWRRHFNSVHVATMFQAQPGPLQSTPNRLLVAEDGHPLLGYAACYWAYHVSKSPVDASELLDSLKAFLSKYFLSWIEAISLSGNLRYLIRSAQFLKAYVKRHLLARPSEDSNHALLLQTLPEHDVEWIQNWATDIIRVVGKFGSSLIHDPPSVYRQLPPFCPKDSMIGKSFGSSTNQESITVTGLKSDMWDDCLASVSVSKDDYVSQVLATETYFVTLVSSGGVIVVWNAETCEQLKVIRAGGYVPLMTLNKAGTAVATVSFDAYSVWELVTGRQLYTSARSADGVVLDLRFGAADYELVMAFSNNKISRIDLRSGAKIEHFIPVLTDPDFSYEGCPWRMAFSPDMTKIAAAWRGRPPLIWDLLPGAAHGPRKCRVTSSSDPICGPELLRWHPDSEVLFVLCQSNVVIEWRIYEDRQKAWAHLNARDIIISEDGNRLLSGDYVGIFSIWNIPDMNLVYRLVTGSGLGAGLAMSPGGQRFYTLRGSVCNVWEPEALICADEQDMEDQSSTRGTTILTEPTISHFDTGCPLMTTLAVDARERYYCCGKEDGRVSIHDAVSGKRLRKVYSHPASCAVVALSWSESGRYIVSCDDGALVIAKRVQEKEDGTWAVFPVFECRLSEAISQLMFSAGEQFILVSTLSADHVWDLKAKERVQTREWADRQSGRWIQHPSRSDVLVWIGPNEVRCHRWPTLDVLQAPVIEEEASSNPTAPGAGLEALAESQPRILSHDQSRCVPWASVTAEKHSILYATLPNDGSSAMSCLSHDSLHIEFLDALNLLEGGISHPAERSCAPNVARHIKHLLGVYKTSIAFLDHDCWFCTWNVQDQTGAVTRHFFIPKDWINTSTSHMAIVNSHGTLFCPRYGEVAVVKNGIRMI
ncbi:NACHT and WD domain-containing protein, variant [Madurella fahalii]|uniref:NACHT and WD domain-containing protein, variant n=1 Tax=Madurella fahalii TaxID=1157608 RepID=A0ABQ0GKH4_9PEZI